MALDANDPRPPFRQIAADLRQLIAAGSLQPGNRLPSTRELMDRYEVASQTVQGAIRQLRAEGLVRSIQGRGTFVLDDLDPASIRTEDHGDGPSAEYLILREHLDRISNEVDDIRQQLSDLVARLPDAAAAKPVVKRSGSAPRRR